MIVEFLVGLVLLVLILAASVLVPVLFVNVLMWVDEKMHGHTWGELFLLFIKIIFWTIVFTILAAIFVLLSLMLGDWFFREVV